MAIGNYNAEVSNLQVKTPTRGLKANLTGQEMINRIEKDFKLYRL